MSRKNTNTFALLICLPLLLLVLGWQSVCRADWPQFRSDASRSGYSAEELAADLSLRWVYKPVQSPRPAWQGEDTRMAFDYVYHTVAAEGMVFFASSADGKVYALPPTCVL